jgi:2-oxoglutarate/2-oxoacid ferredoxin oxidoreductase subunit alpha
MPRLSIKLVGASGQGINSIGEILAKGLKRSGYCVFGYREYPSLIKGGHASYQIDVSNEMVRSSETMANALVALNHHGLEHNLADLKHGGTVIHVTPGWEFSKRHQELIDDRKLRVIRFPVQDILARLGAKPILSNVLLSAYVWAMLGQDVNVLSSLVAEKFEKKHDLIELNMRAVREGYSFVDSERGNVSLTLPGPRPQFSEYLLMTGSQAMGLGAIHAGVRLYAAYPMTPASPLLAFIAELENETQMVVKQAEDEITAAQMVSGATYMGTRALTATSGGGLDLMSETISLNAMIENPTVFVVAQRPGPATGLATWTAQSDLLSVINTAHGEFARCVLSVRNSQDAFDLMPVAFNLAERFQISVVVLTEKQIAEALYTQAPYDLDRAEIRRGKLVTDADGLKSLKSSDRYDPDADGGISLRWLPGIEAATYCAQGDEHDSAGGVDETSHTAALQMTKRMRKLHGLKAELPEPRLLVSAAGEVHPVQVDESGELDLLIISWGSTTDVVEDVMRAEPLRERRLGCLHYTYLWPLRTAPLQSLVKRAKHSVIVEQNFQGQLGMIARMECGLEIPDKILKYDGRPFFYDELLSQIVERTGS